MNLSTKIFTDSNICKKLKCGKAKATSIAQNVLAHSIEKHENSIIFRTKILNRNGRIE
jgi:hypothetical protein